ncbi:MAG: hypothetical protein JO199_13255, partial [Candidatus Eremiobacteraeota bacterium]|nr:hypothetical protein [Candidatus Eremiobacteraeota bacterium]
GLLDDYVCTDFLPVSESDSFKTKELRELDQALWATYRDDQHRLNLVKQYGLPWIDTDALPAPSRVLDIRGKTAIVQLSGSIYEANYYYSEAWNKVWIRNHGRDRCTMLTERWPGGSVTLPNAPFDM